MKTNSEKLWCCVGNINYKPKYIFDVVPLRRLFCKKGNYVENSHSPRFVTTILKFTKYINRLYNDQSQHLTVSQRRIPASLRAKLHLVLAGQPCKRLYSMKFYQKLVIAFHLLVIRYGTVLSFYTDAFFRRKEGTYLADSIIKTVQTFEEIECGMLCSREISCASVNYKKFNFNQGRCELNDKLLEDPGGKKEKDPEFVHLEIVVRVR